MLKYALPLVALISLAVIAGSAGYVLTQPAGHVAGPTPAIASREADEDDEPDPTATGVIAGRAQGWLYTFSPDGEVLSKTSDFTPSLSVSGTWQAGRVCSNTTGQMCQLVFVSSKDSNSALTYATLPGGFRDGEWSPVDDTLAALTDDGGIYLVDPSTLAAKGVGSKTVGFSWTSNGSLVFSTWDGTRAGLWLVAAGQPRHLADLASPVTTFVPSPDGSRLAFAQDGVDGWRLSALEQTGALADIANLGKITQMPALRNAPDVAISWSPDGSRVAVSPVAVPFVMFVMSTVSSARPATFRFDEGYAGEMKWSPDGSELAISTYSLDRSQHRVYVLDSPESTQPRRLIDGCLIFWSPDGRFLVAKPEPYANDIAAVRVSDGAYWKVSAMPTLTPASWGTDEEGATRLAQLPARGIGGLGK